MGVRRGVAVTGVGERGGREPNGGKERTRGSRRKTEVEGRRWKRAGEKEGGEAVSGEGTTENVVPFRGAAAGKSEVTAAVWWWWWQEEKEEEVEEEEEVAEEERRASERVSARGRRGTSET